MHRYIKVARDELKNLRKANKDLDKGWHEREKSTAANGWGSTRTYKPFCISGETVLPIR